MCRVLVYLGKKEVSLYDLLYAPDNSLIRQSYDPKMMHAANLIQNLAGFGVTAWSKSSKNPRRPFHYKTTELPFFDENLYFLSKKIFANCILAHVRGVNYGLGQSVIQENTHPFLYKGYSLALAENGNIADMSLMKSHLAKHIKQNILGEILGNTDTEWLYALLLSQFEDPRAPLELDEVCDALKKTLSIFRDIRNQLGLHKNSPLNLFITNGEYAIVTRFAFDFGLETAHDEPFFAYHSLWFTYGEKYGEYDGTYKMHGEKSRENILFASEPLTEDRTTWVELPEYSLSKIWMDKGEFIMRTLDLNV